METTPQLRAAYALHMARQHRHHRDCRCGVVDGYCSPEDARWSQAMNAELEAFSDS